MATKGVVTNCDVISQKTAGNNEWLCPIALRRICCNFPYESGSSVPL